MAILKQTSEHVYHAVAQLWLKPVPLCVEFKTKAELQGLGQSVQNIQLDCTLCSESKTSLSHLDRFPPWCLDTSQKWFVKATVSARPLVTTLLSPSEFKRTRMCKNDA